MDIGGRIREARKARGMTQEELARRAGMSLKGMGDIERGAVPDPHYTSLSKIAEGLGVPIGELLGELAPLGEAPQEEAGPPADTEDSYTAFETLGRVLASRWSGELEAWDEKVPDGEVPDSFDFGRLFEWSLDIARTCKHYSDIARHDGQVPRPELESTLGEMTNAAWKAGVKVKRVLESAKTSVEFQKIVEANDLEAVLNRAGRDA